jgi:hypothetical protein
VHLLASAVKKDYGAGQKMGHVTFKHVLPGVGSMDGESRMVRPLCTNRMLPFEGLGGYAPGPADRSLLSSACCGTDAGAATAAICEKTLTTKIGVVF